MSTPVFRASIPARIATLLSACLVAVAAAAAPTSNEEPPEANAQAEALARARAAMVGVHATAVEDANSIGTLGRERHGSGVVVADDGLVLTIGYLILEAEHVDLELDDGRALPARVVAYDLATGFGLLQPLAPLHIEPVPLGRSGELAPNEPLMFASGGSDGSPSPARLVSRHAFSGYWEYHIDGALFTAPARSDHSGAGLFNADGELLGIGSLLLGESGAGRTRASANMFVPIDLLKPILAELRERGASRASTRAWLGLNCVELDGGVRVVRVTRDGPAEQAGLQFGDLILRLDGIEIPDLESLYKTLWRDGAEREVSIEIRRGGQTQTLTAQTLDRMKTLRRPQGI